MENKLVGIISYNTHSYHLNYGTALHSYAFQKYLRKRNVSSVIIDYIPNALVGYNEKWPIFNYLKFWHVNTFLKHIIDWGLGWNFNLKKYEKFQGFYRQHYVKTEKAYTFEDLKTMNNVENQPINIWVCESDVIWKLYNKDEFDEAFYLNLPLMNGGIKVAYSPSMGSRKFCESEEKKFIEMTHGFRAISCREKESAEYLSSILNRPVSHVLDPTLLLDANDYSEIIVEPEEEHYLLCFNCMHNDKEMVIESQRLAERLGLKMIEISNYDQNRYCFKHQVLTDVGIEEFLGYFKNADFIVCSSFHGCCFAITFRKQFFLFQRDNTDMRMPGLTESLGCSNRLVTCDDKKIPESFDDINYSLIEEKLSKLREVSYKFIDDNIVNL